MHKASIAYYRPSGSFRATTFMYFLLAMIVGVGVSWLYSLLIRLIPLIYLNIFICIGFGLVVGAGGYLAVRLGHCRNRGLALLLALPLALVPLAATYYWDYRHVAEQAAEHEGLATVPPTGVTNFIEDLQPYLNYKKTVGWSVSHRGRESDLNGSAVFVIWGIEVALMLGAVFFVVSSAPRAPYCENCQSWCDAWKSRTFPGIPVLHVQAMIEHGDLAALLQLPDTGNDRAHDIRLTGTYCLKCTSTGFLSVTDVWTYGTDNKGQAQTKDKKLLQDAVLSPDQRAHLLARLESKESSNSMPTSTNASH